MSDLVHSSTRLSSMPSRKAVRCVRVPSDLVLTPRVLLGAVRTLRSADIQAVVDELVDELNIRSGDPDLEREPND
jgi:hypothetical protein